MPNHTTWQRTFKAVGCLVMDRPIQIRLEAASMELCVLHEDDFPTELKEEYIEIRELILPDGNIDSMTNKELEEIAERILSLYDEIATVYCTPP